MGVKKHVRNEKLNNEGFSLVELLIAITILAIIVAPLLHSFVSAMNTNAKARRTMNSTQIAEDIMEEFEAHSIKEMEELYTGYEVKWEDEKDAAGNTLAKDAKVTFTGSAEVSSQKYDVEIVLDSTRTDYENINGIELADIRNLSGSTNAVYVDSSAEIAAAYKYFNNYALGTYDDAAIAANTTRNIDINISSVPISLDVGGAVPSTVNVYMVTASVQYSCSSIYLQNYAPTKYPQNANEYIIFSNEADVREQAEEIKAGTSGLNTIVSRLANIIVCIEPRKNGGDDYITVHNENNVDTNIYLVMQGSEADTEDPSCRVHYDLYEAPGAWMPSAGDDSTTAKCRLRTNLLSNQVIYYGYHNVNNNSGLSGQAYQNDKGEFVIGADNGGSGVKALKILQADTLTPTSRYNRIYEITVKVYADGTRTTQAPIISMTGTVTDSIKAD